jgi:isochorismate synthase
MRGTRLPAHARARDARGTARAGTTRLSRGSTDTLNAVKSVTSRFDADLDPRDIGVLSGCLWSSAGMHLAGVGEAMRIPIDRTAGSNSEAQQVLADLAGPDDIALPGTGPVAFAAMPFDPTAPAELVVPEIVIGRGREGRRWITTVGDASLGMDDVLERLRDIGPAPVQQPTEMTITTPVPPEVWRDEIVAVARDRIRAGELTKAVLARELVLRSNAPIDQAAVLSRLLATHRSATVFALEGFVGASPELLVSRVDDVVRAHPLAGTAARESDPVADQAAAAGLLASSKDRWEHRITIDWLLNELLPFCSYVDAEPDPGIVSLPNVHHLGTRVEGRLSSPPASVLDLVQALHPTPAVGGDPQADAIALIAELERSERGRYAGPAGWVDGSGNGSFVVAIRSAELDGNVARLFAGVGVVGDSDPAAELAETRAKFQAMLPALLRL